MDPYSRNFPKVKREYDYRGRAIPSFEDTIRSDSSIGAWTREGNTRERGYILDFSNLLWMNSSSFFFFLHIISVFTFFTICEKIIYSKFIDFSLKLERSMEDLKVGVKLEI